MEFQITVGIGLAAVFVAIVLPVIISYIERERKLVYWDVLSSESLSSFKISEKLEMKVMFDGKPLDDISTIELKVWNAGNKAILKSDYDKPIKFTFQEDSEILFVRLENSPENLAEEDIYEPPNKSILFKSFNFNPEDIITLTILLTPQFNGEVIQYGRLIDGKIKALVNTELTRSGYVKSIGSAYKVFLIPLKRLLLAIPVVLVMGVYWIQKAGHN